MRFHYASQLWAEFPNLVAGVLHVRGITPDPDVRAITAEHRDVALGRLAQGTGSDLPQIKAWRRTFATMGLKPTQYRCAAESLLRRFAKERQLPSIHPLVDLYNHVSIRTAIPIGAFDIDHVVGDLLVTPASGQERYLSFAGQVETPPAGEIVFADASGAAHARRWCHRQSAASAIRPDSTDVLVVVEAMHVGGGEDVRAALYHLAAGVQSAWGLRVRTAVLTGNSPDFSTDE